ncbi:hypothetical protein BKA67DRAFT_179413 [Truncatella angustata]|uniref:SWR1-complex protein 3 domain-containing protein n=1 Tax=Truncatella angustata TaxID=152316 RepID=A0A9P8US87_9PEZI|nr:uncharacterized protein BKA67DRAFT_179413 [Truncatella angustata]KAH6657090.1 hypothetical protein BKA67DRAFT_179413 [Truncatella angustata]KAH8197494.1 hypothetical protein TruAng_008352 [Truncatella angustata]
MTGGVKRKNPPRGAARVEQVAKKRTSTPPERAVASAQPPPPAVPEPEQEPEPGQEPVVQEPQLPTSIQAGNPLPTVENAQSEELSGKDYQSIQESGVLAESLTRSRQKWINEGIFEKYWTKPVKRKGVVKEEPNNPPKDSMQKIGNIIITIEPHLVEATMFGIKDNTKSTAPTTNSTFRPVMQYGPPNGVMPPPPPPPKPSTPATPTTPSAVPASPSQAPAQPAPPSGTPLQPPTQAPAVSSQSYPSGQPPSADSQRSQSAAPLPNLPRVSPSTGPGSVLAAPGAPPVPQAPQAPQASQPPLRSPAPQSQAQQPLASPATTTAQPGLSRPQAPSPSPTTAGTPTTPGAQKPPTPGVQSATPAPAGADPIIVTLAEKASHDPHLRDLMKRVAVGQAAPDELADFQKIIDAITREYKKNGGQQGPSADRLIVDGRTVKYFADEVRAILDIVLASNPQQKASDLRVPVDSDPLVILLVKKALEDGTTKNMVRRVATNQAKFSDATDLKAILDRLKDLVSKGGVKAEVQPPVANASNTVANGASARKASVSQASAAPTSQQALRSKGPPPSFRTEFSAIALEFSGGTGDRYLFPKFSILEYQPGASQVLASFLIVRKGSKSEYGGDPALDYYQPMTIRISSPSGKHLEQIARVVAPQDEVRRYMDDIMDNMTRAEYILLAMRLPRSDKEDRAEERSETPKFDRQLAQPQPQQGILWTAKTAPAKLAPQPAAKMITDDEQYQSFIATVS